MSLEVKCIFLHSGLLLSKIYFIKQTFVIKECVVFTCGPVSNEINHFHLISLCTDSYLTVCPGAVPSPARAGSEGGHVGTRFLPAHHTNLTGVFPKTQNEPRIQDVGKQPPNPPTNPSRVKPSFPGQEERSGPGRARRGGQALPAPPALPRWLRPRCRHRPGALRGAGTRGAVCSFRAFSSPCKSPRVSRMAI